MTDQTQAAEPFSTTPPAAPAPAVPYEVALSWGGFNLYGDRKSIDEAKRLKHDADTVPELKRAYASLLAATPAAPSQEPVTLTDSMIDAADDYLRRFKHWHGLPAEFRWHEMWDAMMDAALREKEGHK